MLIRSFIAVPAHISINNQGIGTIDVITKFQVSLVKEQICFSISADLPPAKATG
jgi:hypothetical protein